jgi:hypothetical protein
VDDDSERLRYENAAHPAVARKDEGVQKHGRYDTCANCQGPQEGEHCQKCQWVYVADKNLRSLKTETFGS